MQTSFSDYDLLPIKTEKFVIEDHESEISKWLKLENDPLPPIGNSNSSYNIFSLPSVGPSIGHSSNSSMTSNSMPSQSGFHPHSPLGDSSTALNFGSSSAHSPMSSSVSKSCSHELQEHHQLTLSNNQFAHNTDSDNQSNTFSSFPNFSNQYSSINNGDSTTQYSNYSFHQFPTFPSNSNTHPINSSSSNNSSKQFTSNASNSSSQPGFNFGNSSNFSVQNSQYANNSNCPTHFTLPQFSPNHFGTNPIPDLQQLATPQLYQLFAQFQQIIKNQSDEINDDKKRKPIKPVVRRVRQTRPKVVEAKGGVQCKGKNRKKGMQCRNAALMEYIGPRPAYCAEHIELDSKSLYEKCKSSYQKEVGDNKGCKEVVLKEFGVCYKHYTDLILELGNKKDFDTIRKHQERIIELLSQLEREASAAKKKDGDLYQRKNKLIPKFQEMRKIIFKAVEALDGGESGISFAMTLTKERERSLSPRSQEALDISPMNPDDLLGGSLIYSDSSNDNIMDAITDVSDD
jgi:hypothetical protein